MGRGYPYSTGILSSTSPPLEAVGGRLECNGISMDEMGDNTKSLISIKCLASLSSFVNISATFSFPDMCWTLTFLA